MIFPVYQIARNAWCHLRRVPDQNAFPQTTRRRCEKTDHGWGIPPCRQWGSQPGMDGIFCFSARAEQSPRDPALASAQKLPRESARPPLENYLSRDGRCGLNRSAHAMAIALARQVRRLQSPRNRKHADCAASKQYPHREVELIARAAAAVDRKRT